MPSAVEPYGVVVVVMEFLDFRIMGVAYKRVEPRPPFSCCYGRGSDVEWLVHGGTWWCNALAIFL